jgi:DNA-binding MltR family transcriptional regulator
MGSSRVSKTKDPLTRLLKQVPSPQEYQVAWENVRKDGSRGSVILAGTLVEDSLRALLISRMAPGVEKDGSKDLFGPMKPLSTFSAKIRMGFAMKLYGERTFDDLELLKKLRNLFAHGRLAIDFNTPEVKSAINQFHCHSRGERDPRKRFYSVTTLLLSHLNLRRRDPKQGVKGLD